MSNEYVKEPKEHPVNKKSTGEIYKLEIPLDASGVEDFKPEQAVKV